MDSEEGGKKATSNKKRPRTEPDEESVKRQKIGETSASGEEQSAEKETKLSEEELQKLLVVVPVEEVYVEALQKFNRDNLVKLWDLVKKRFSTTEPTNDKEKELWVELKRFSCITDEYWNCYSHADREDISSYTRDAMMVARLLVEADSEMSRELLRKIFYQANRPRQGGLLGIRGFYNLMLMVQVYAAAEY
ncbi:hypothetical protein Tco_1149162 [Tanacetum coccineum]